MRDGGTAEPSRWRTSDSDNGVEPFTSAGRSSRLTRPADWLLAVASVWLVLLALSVLSVAIGVVVAVMRESSGWYIGGALGLSVASVLSAAAGLYLLARPRWRWTLFTLATLAAGAAWVTVSAAV